MKEEKKPIYFRTVVIPFSLSPGDSNFAPATGSYKNALVVYEADHSIYLYDSEGVYTRIGYFTFPSYFVSTALPDAADAVADAIYIVRSTGLMYITHDNETWIQVAVSVIDDTLSLASENMVENAAVATAVSGLSDAETTNSEATVSASEKISSLSSSAGTNAEAIEGNAEEEEENEAAVTSLKTSEKENEKETAANTKSITSLNTQSSKNASNIETIATEVTNAESSLSSLATVATSGSYTDLIDAPVNNIDSELSAVSENVVENKAVYSAINNLSSAAAENWTSVAALPEEIETLEEKINETASALALAGFSASIETVKTELTELQTATDQASPQYETLETLETSVDLIISTQFSAVSTLEELAVTVAENTEKITANAADIDELKTEIERQSTLATAITEEIETVSEKITEALEYEGTANENTENIAALSEAIDENTENISENAERIAALQNSGIGESAATTEEITSLKETISESTETIATNAESIETNATAIEDLQNTVTNSLAAVAWSGDYNDIEDAPVIDLAMSSASENALANSTINSVITTLSGSSYLLVDSLPATGESIYIYLAPATTNASDSNRYDEYIWVESTSSFEELGSTAPVLDDYYTADEVTEMLAAKETSDDVGTGTLTIQRNGTTLGTFSANATASAVINIIVPTKVSALDDFSTYVLASALADVATSGDYDDLSDKPTIPTVYDNTITITMDGTTAGTFTTNDDSEQTIALTSNVTKTNTYTTTTTSQKGLLKYYATCFTSASTAAKVAIVTTSDFSLVKGVEVIVYFTYKNSASSFTLNVAGTGAKSVYYAASTVPTYYWHPYEAVHFVYNGSAWMVTGGVANTAYYGNTKLTSTYTSNQGTSTALSGKGAYNLYTSVNSAIEDASSTVSAKVLYTNTSGTASSITLSASVTKFDVIEIIYRNDNNYCASVMFDPSMRSAVVLNSGYHETTCMYIKETKISVSGVKITFNGYADFRVTPYNEIPSQSLVSTTPHYILKVIGWSF